MSKQETAEKDEMHEKSLSSNLAELELDNTDEDSRLTKFLTYVIFFMLGLGVVLPWNAIGGLIVALIQFTITATGYSEAGQNKLSDEVEVAATLTRAKAYFGAALLISLLNLGLLFALPLLSTYRKYTAIHMTNSTTTTSINIKSRSQQILSALSTVRYTSLAVFLNFVVTLALFPSITSSVRTNYPSASGLYVALFVSLHFVLFNLGDVTGRFLLGFPALRPRSSLFLLFFSLARLVFFLLFLTSRLDFNNPSLTQAFPVWINNDIIFFILMFLFAVSNGYVGSGTMMFAPSQASDPLIIPVIGNVMTFSLTVGLAFGSFLSFALRAAVCQCNSFSS